MTTKTTKTAKYLTCMVCITLISFGLISPAYAYLDGGTGSIIIQSIIATIAGLLAVIRIYWNKLKHFTRKLFGKKKHDDERQAQP